MVDKSVKTAIRNLWRQKNTSLINIIGLSIGMAGCLIISLFVFNETNYDSFHKHAGNIYKVYQHTLVNGEESFDAVTPVPMAATLLADYPEVKNVVRMYQSDNLLTITDQGYFNIKNALYVDSSFFRVFSFGLIKGDMDALSDPGSVVLTESTAAKIFGTADPINKMIRFENDTNYFRVSGVSLDPPENSHFTFDMLISMDAFWDNNSTFWLRNNVNTYVLLQDGFPFQNLEQKFPEMIKKYIGPQLQQVFGFSMDDFMKKGNYLRYKLQPIRDIHLDTTIHHNLKPSGNRKYVYIFSLVGIFILVIAAINFINLSTARSTKRAPEVGLRKVFGSSRKKLILQFLSESILISIISLAIAFSLVNVVLPSINRMTDLTLSLSAFNPFVLIAIILGSAIIIGIIAGIYPAFFLSSFNIASVLKGRLRTGNRWSTLRRLLVIIQFFIAIVILSCTLVIYQQLTFMQSKDLGFDKERVMVIKQANSLKNQLGTFMEEIRKYPGIVSITNSSAVPGYPNGDDGFIIEGRGKSETYVLQTSWVDFSFISSYKMKIIDGRDFTQDFTTDSSAVIINEAAVKKIVLKNPVGTRLMRPGENGKYNYFTIIGVVKDFHFQSLHKEIQPFLLLIKPAKANWGGYLSIRLGEGGMTRYVQVIKNTWKQYTKDRPLEYSFLDEDLNNLYKEERRTGSLSVTFTFLAIFIACLGLLGLISFTTAQRTKEIGIRKIMGSSVWGIIKLLLSETILLIIISSLLAWPVAWLFLKNWLADFAFRVELKPVIFLETSSIILILSVWAIGLQTWRAAVKNPVVALRYE
jgi:putative ABC transport system permease protein